MQLVLRAAIVAAAALVLGAASSNLPAATPALSNSQPDQSYTLVLDDAKATTETASAALPYDFEAPIDADKQQTINKKVGSLKALVSAEEEDQDALDPELKCLATAVYFESKGEPLEGQLAVAQVIINRVQSQRFADSICGVVNQPNQFSFSKTGKIREHSSSWKTAIAIARIANSQSWAEITPDALFFHANYVSPSWRHGRERISQIGAHVFYR